jgi:membrane protein YqaA with SNARE-associated domain
MTIRIIFIAFMVAGFLIGYGWHHTHVAIEASVPGGSGNVFIEYHAPLAVTHFGTKEECESRWMDMLKSPPAHDPTFKFGCF